MKNNCLMINNLAKSYQGEVILREINLEIGLGDSVAIIGNSGSGKSTLLHLIGGLLGYKEGSIKFNGREISSFSEEENCYFRNQYLGFIYQKAFLIKNLTVLENVLLPLKLRNFKVSREKALELLGRLKLSGRISSYPSELSGGERQRVAIARALITKPLLILADEPTGNLDQGNSYQVLSEFLTLVKEKGSTLIMVTHDLGIANELKKRYLLVDGKLEKC